MWPTKWVTRTEVNDGKDLCISLMDLELTDHSQRQDTRQVNPKLHDMAYYLLLWYSSYAFDCHKEMSTLSTGCLLCYHWTMCASCKTLAISGMPWHS